jgi:hypothetical protein
MASSLKRKVSEKPLHRPALCSQEGKNRNNVRNWNNWQSQNDLSEGYCRFVPLMGGIG